MQDLQQLMKPHNVRDQKGVLIATRPPIIKTIFKFKPNLKRSEYPICLACKLATAKVKSTNVVALKPIALKEGALSCNEYKPGNSNTTCQFIAKTPGCLHKDYGGEVVQYCFHGGTIF